MTLPVTKAKAMFAGKNVLIFGLGLLGGAVGDARFFVDLGANVKVTDAKTPEQLEPTLAQLKGYPITASLGGHKAEDIEWADVIVRNPSVKLDHPLLQSARASNKKIVMRSSLFAELAGVTTIGITGTRGKTTTTTMIYDIVRHCSGKKTLLGGNVLGKSDLELLAVIDNPGDTIAVLELSSWQLQGFAESRLSPHISVLTNLYPDHLNVYPDLDTYFADKRIIFEFQHSCDVVLFNDGQPEFHGWAGSAPGRVGWFSGDKLPSGLQLSLPGNHNRANAAAALSVAAVLGYPETAAVEVLNRFTAVPYRYETVRVHEGITYINDTTATTPVAASMALESTIKPPVLICGGADKNLPIEQFAEMANHRSKKIILLKGSGTERLKPFLTSSLIAGEASSMNQAVEMAKAASGNGDTVLLSPGFASFGLFNNEFDRGDQFNQCVLNLP